MDAARASANVNVDHQKLLAQLLRKIGLARTTLTVHRLIDLSRSVEITGALSPRELEAQLSHKLAEAQAVASAEIQACRFRPQPNVLISLRLRECPLRDAGVKAVAQALLLRAPLTLHVLSLAAVGARDDGVSALAAALAATGAAHLAPLHLSTSPIAC